MNPGGPPRSTRTASSSLLPKPSPGPCGRRRRRLLTWTSVASLPPWAPAPPPCARAQSSTAPALFTEKLLRTADSPSDFSTREDASDSDSPSIGIGQLLSDRELAGLRSLSGSDSGGELLESGESGSSIPSPQTGTSSLFEEEELGNAAGSAGEASSSAGGGDRGELGGGVLSTSGEEDARELSTPENESRLDALANGLLSGDQTPSADRAVEVVASSRQEQGGAFSLQETQQSGAAEGRLSSEGVVATGPAEGSSNKKEASQQSSAGVAGAMTPDAKAAASGSGGVGGGVLSSGTPSVVRAGNGAAGQPSISPAASQESRSASQESPTALSSPIQTPTQKTGSKGTSSGAKRRPRQKEDNINIPRPVGPPGRTGAAGSATASSSSTALTEQALAGGAGRGAPSAAPSSAGGASPPPAAAPASSPSPSGEAGTNGAAPSTSGGTNGAAPSTSGGTNGAAPSTSGGTNAAAPSTSGGTNGAAPSTSGGTNNPSAGGQNPAQIQKKATAIPNAVAPPPNDSEPDLKGDENLGGKKTPAGDSDADADLHVENPMVTSVPLTAGLASKVKDKIKRVMREQGLDIGSVIVEPVSTSNYPATVPKSKADEMMQKRMEREGKVPTGSSAASSSASAALQTAAKNDDDEEDHEGESDEDDDHDDKFTETKGFMKTWLKFTSFASDVTATQSLRGPSYLLLKMFARVFYF